MRSDLNILDHRLWQQLREGEEKAFSTVFDAYYRYLYVLAYRFLMSEEAAEDAVQYTFMRLWEGRAGFDYRKGIKNLLFTILKNYVLNEIRHNNMALQKRYEIAQAAEEADVNFLHRLEEADFKTHLYRLIDQLTPQRRQICLLKIQDGLSNQEIADMLHISIPTVKSHYTQAIKLLRSQINKIIALVLCLKPFF